MKIKPIRWSERLVHQPLRRGGFTFVEIMIASTMFLMAIAALLTVHIFGLRLFELSKAKMGASDDVRTSLAYFLDEVRSNQLILVGTGNVSSFVGISSGSAQVGNAIQMYPTNNPASTTFVRYYLASNQLMRITNGQITPKLLVHSVSNVNVFAGQDIFGNTQTNPSSCRVISMFFQITQLYSPSVPICTGSLFDFYQLRVKATRRN